MPSREKFLLRKKSIQKQDAKRKQRPKAITNNLLEILLIKLNDTFCASQARAHMFCLSSEKSTLGSGYWTDAHKPSTTIPIKSAVNLCFSPHAAGLTTQPTITGTQEKSGKQKISIMEVRALMASCSLTCQQGFLSYSDKLVRILNISLQMPSTNVIILKAICNNPISHWVPIWLSNSISKH